MKNLNLSNLVLLTGLVKMSAKLSSLATYSTFIVPTILDKTICDTLLKHSFVGFLPFRPESFTRLPPPPPQPPKTMLDVLSVFYECNVDWMVGERGRFSKCTIILRHFVKKLEVSQMFCPGLSVSFKFNNQGIAH